MLLGSYLFYGLANGKLLFLILFSTLIDYLVALKMSDITDKESRKPFLYISLFSNLGMLGLFKYYNFFNDSFAELFFILNLEYAIPALSLILPVGISFYTFQTLGYTIDVYKGRIKAETHFGYFALYVSYFPQLVAGPIERSSHLIPQLKTKQAFSFSNLKTGLKRIGLGLFKKVVIADQISLLVSYVADQPDSFGGFSILLSSLLFTIQVYCDFSGYSDMAVGIARVFGVRLMENFNRPFFAKTISELWKRWHISLILWFRDYIFIPLGGTRGSRVMIIRNVLVIFFISGLWHGADYKFILWGGLNGVLIVIYLEFKKLKTPLSNLTLSSRQLRIVDFLKRIRTYVIFSVVGIFFLANTFSDAITLLYGLLGGWKEDMIAIFQNANNSREKVLYLGSSVIEFGLIILSITVVFISHYLKEFTTIRFADFPLPLRYSVYVSLVFSIVLFSFQQEMPFYYFQF